MKFLVLNVDFSSLFRTPSFNEAYARRCQIGVPPKKWLFCYWLV